MSTTILSWAFRKDGSLIASHPRPFPNDYALFAALTGRRRPPTSPLIDTICSNDTYSKVSPLLWTFDPDYRDYHPSDQYGPITLYEACIRNGNIAYEYFDPESMMLYVTVDEILSYDWDAFHDCGDGKLVKILDAVGPQFFLTLVKLIADGFDLILFQYY